MHTSKYGNGKLLTAYFALSSALAMGCRPNGAPVSKPEQAIVDVQAEVVNTNRLQITLTRQNPQKSSVKLVIQGSSSVHGDDVTKTITLKFGKKESDSVKTLSQRTLKKSLKLSPGEIFTIKKIGLEKGIMKVLTGTLSELIVTGDPRPEQPISDLEAEIVEEGTELKLSFVRTNPKKGLLQLFLQGSSATDNDTTREISLQLGKEVPSNLQTLKTTLRLDQQKLSNKLSLSPGETFTIKRIGITSDDTKELGGTAKELVVRAPTQVISNVKAEVVNTDQLQITLTRQTPEEGKVKLFLKGIDSEKEEENVERKIVLKFGKEDSDNVKVLDQKQLRTLLLVQPGEIFTINGIGLGKNTVKPLEGSLDELAVTGTVT